MECPGTGRVYLTDDGTDANELIPGNLIRESMQEAIVMPNVSGNCTAYFCADYQHQQIEPDESDNCATLSFTLQPRPLPPVITVTNPTTGDNWRSSNTKHITWTSANFPTLGHVRIEYSLNGDSTWRTIESSTPNDGSRYWNMCNFYTTDSTNSYLRITSVEYPAVSDLSDRFIIDHAKGCK